MAEGYQNKRVERSKAAMLEETALTAWISLHLTGELPVGAKILIHRASGTAGSFAVQFAKAAGAYVIGTASAKNRDHVLRLGADSTIDRSWAVLKQGDTIVIVADPSILDKVPEVITATSRHPARCGRV